MTNIEFLIKVLDKQFSLANCSRTTEEVIEMSEEEQAKFWKEYTLTPSQFDEWKQFFIDTAKDNEEFEEIYVMENTQEIIEYIFETIAEEWSFKVVEKKETVKVEE
jgi:hypothetical protein